MLEFIKSIMRHRIEQIHKSETTKEEETNTNKNINDSNLSERYREVLILLIEISNLLDDIDEIPKTVKKKIIQLEVKTNNLFKNFLIASTEIKYDDIQVLALAYINLGYIYFHKEDNLNTAKDNLNIAKDYYMRCIELLKEKELHYKFIVIAIYALNFLHEIWKKLHQLENCYLLLDKALELYLSYTKEDDYPEPFADIFFHYKENTKIYLINVHIITLERMAELYFLQPTNMHKFVIYIHNLLNEQLKTIKDSPENHMFSCWADASASLSIFFLESNRFMEAKIHLAAADYMIMMCYVLILTNNAKSQEKLDTYGTVRIFITELWAMYGIMLIHSSKERLLQYENNKSCEANNIESHSKSEEEITKPLTFVDLEKGLKNIIKYYITDTYVSNLDDIKIIFGNVLRWLDEVFVYYSKKNQFISEVQTMFGISKAYKYYVYFEGSKNTQIKIIQQQIKVLENFISEVSSKYNRSPEYHYIKKLHFELAIAYSTLLDKRSEELDEIEEVTDKMKMETRELVTNIIHNFDLCINIS